MTQQPKRTASVRRAEQRIGVDPTRPGTFDLGAFIASATLPEDKRPQLSAIRTIQVTIHPDIAGELKALYDEAEQLDQAVRVAKEVDTAVGGPTPSRGRRLGSKSERTQRLKELRARIKELEEALEGSWLDIRLRGILPTEQDKVRALKIPVGVRLAAAVFSLTGKVRQADGRDDVPDDDPSWGTLSIDQWVELLDTIGPVQYVYLDQAHAALTHPDVTPDFFERFSASRATRNTSAS